MEIPKNIKGLESEQLRDKLAEFGIKKSFEEGETILDEHSYISSIPIVIKGSVKVMQSDDDYREMLLYYLRPGETCIMSFLGGMHRETSKIKAVAEEPTEILMVPIEKASWLTREHPEWLEYIFKLYHKRFEELLEVTNAVAFKKMDERLLEFLRKKSEVAGSQELSITHEQIARELGTARVVVSRLLKQMENEDLVELGRNKITLL